MKNQHENSVLENCCEIKLLINGDGTTDIKINFVSVANSCCEMKQWKKILCQIRDSLKKQDIDLKVLHYRSNKLELFCNGKKLPVNVNVHITKRENSCFDLLCDGNRVPFSEGKNKNPVGIFPFKDEDTYLSLKESEDCLRRDANSRFFPSRKFWERCFEIKDELNWRLKMLQSKPLEGDYFTTCDYQNGANWIVSFDENKTGYLFADYYNSNELAKARYVGTL